MSLHPWGVGMPTWLQLHEFACVVRQAYGHSPILVGSALTTKTPRDIDVRVILTADEYARLVGPVGHTNLPFTAWAAQCLAFSALGQQMTGKMIDFQVQHEEVAWPYKDEPRIVLGTVTREPQ